jgi:hypothetical protein
VVISSRQHKDNPRSTCHIDMCLTACSKRFHRLTKVSYVMVAYICNVISINEIRVFPKKTHTFSCIYMVLQLRFYDLHTVAIEKNALDC